EQLIDNKRKKITSTQETLFYKKMYSNGICHVTDNTYSKMIRFSDISYQLSQDETKQRIFAQYSTLLNMLGNNVKIQFCFINYKMPDVESNEKEILKEIENRSDVDIDQFELIKKEYFSFLEEQRQKG